MSEEQEAQETPASLAGLEPGQFDEWRREIKRRAPKREGKNRQPKEGLADPLERQIIYLARRYGRYQDDFDLQLKHFWRAR